MDEEKQKIFIEVVIEVIKKFNQANGGLPLCEIKYCLKTAIWDHLIWETLQPNQDAHV